MMGSCGELLAQPRDAGIRCSGNVDWTGLDGRHATEGVVDQSLLSGCRDDKCSGCQSRQLEQSPLQSRGVRVGVAPINEESQRVLGLPFLGNAEKGIQVCLVQFHLVVDGHGDDGAGQPLDMERRSVVRGKHACCWTRYRLIQG